jgi:hypothetical protein
VLQANFLSTRVKDTKGDLRKQVGLSAESTKTCEGAGALTKEQGGTFCSLTYLYLPVKIVSNVESNKERERPNKGSEAKRKKNLKNCIHHTDADVRYYSDLYT